MSRHLPRYHVDPADLPYLVAEYGIHHFEPEVNDLLLRLRMSGQRGVLVDVLADQSAPPVAHERALGRLLGALRPARTHEHSAAA